MLTRWGRVAVALAAVGWSVAGVLFAVPTRADNARERGDCAAKEPARRIAGCTRVIEINGDDTLKSRTIRARAEFLQRRARAGDRRDG
jgi:hypothetical protein